VHICACSFAREESQLFPTYGQWVFDILIVIFKEYFRGPDGKSFFNLSSKYSITFLSFSSQRLTYKNKEKNKKVGICSTDPQNDLSPAD
jgi:hypothetical protein